VGGLLVGGLAWSVGGGVAFRSVEYWRFGLFCFKVVYVFNNFLGSLGLRFNFWGG
jgi:hypothetical protein